MPGRQVKPRAGRDTRSVRPEDLFPERPWCTRQRKEGGDARMSMVTGVSPAAAPGGAVRAVELAIGGMTCASCAARVEKKLSKLDGVTATVNFATGTARVSFPAALPATDLISVVEQAGYTAALPAPPGEPAGGAAEEDGAGETAALRQRLLVSAGAGHPGGRAGDDPALAVPELAVGLPGAGLPGGRVGSVAVPPRRGRQRPARRRDHGHAGLGRGHRGVPVVGVRAVLRRRGPGGRAHERRLAGARAAGREPSTWTSPPG